MDAAEAEDPAYLRKIIDAAETKDEEEGLLRVLVTQRDLVTSAATVTEEQTVQRARFTGTVAEKRFMERKWCETLLQAM